jgi:hypothetical protein
VGCGTRWNGGEWRDYQNGLYVCVMIETNQLNQIRGSKAEIGHKSGEKARLG